VDGVGGRRQVQGGAPATTPTHPPTHPAGPHPTARPPACNRPYRRLGAERLALYRSHVKALSAGLPPLEPPQFCRRPLPRTVLPTLPPPAPATARRARHAPPGVHSGFSFERLSSSVMNGY
jgi:hypothetical protein